MREKPMLIGIAGPSCSGKTTLCNQLHVLLGEMVSVLSYDDYYISRRDRTKQNIDEESSDAYRHVQFASDLKTLQEGIAIELFPNSRETTDAGILRKTIIPKPIILVEGFLLYNDPQVRSLFNKKFYLDIKEEEMVRRRIARRGAIVRRHDTDDYINNHLIPGYRRYVLPQKQYADAIIDGMLPAEILANQVLKRLGKV